MNFRIAPCVAFAGVMALAVVGNSSYASDAMPTPALYSQLEAFHGHICAGSIFGARLGTAAKAALKEAGGTGKFTATYYDLSCPLDGIQMAAGTTYGNTALTVLDRDEHRLVLTATGNKRRVEARLTVNAESLGLKSRELGKKAKEIPADSAERMKLEHEIENIYAWLKTAPTSEVVSITNFPPTKGVFESRRK
jgi:formylmethanofuran dehydrogenase subunit E